MYVLELMNENDYEEVWAIMEESFPVSERRSHDGQRNLLREPHYRLYSYKTDGKTAAFFAVWEFEEFAFIEHFAVDKGSRNGGIGAVLLGQLQKRLAKTVILEVELPEGEMERRRIGFYERNGFYLNEYAYVQPKLCEEGAELSLKIMSYPKAISAEAFETFRDTLYRIVYKVK